MLTISCSINSVELSFSALKRIETYLRSAQTQERLCGLSILSTDRGTAAKNKKQADVLRRRY